MDMIGHQDVGVNRKSIALPVMFNSPQIGSPVPLVAKDLLPVIPTRDNVIKCPFKFNARFSGHPGGGI
jgi:hypothetical protein